MPAKEKKIVVPKWGENSPACIPAHTIRHLVKKYKWKVRSETDSSGKIRPVMVKGDFVSRHLGIVFLTEEDFNNFVEFAISDRETPDPQKRFASFPC